MPEQPNPQLNRRYWAAGVLGCAAAGIWTALHREPTPAPPPSGDPLTALWSLQLSLLDGRNQAAAAWRGRPLVVNFWATWCPPCIEELPLLDDFYKQKRAKGWQMIAIAADSEPKVREFLAKRPLHMSVAVLGAEAIGLSKTLGNLVGGLPFTLVLDSSGAVAQRKSGQVKPEDLVHWASLT